MARRRRRDERPSGEASMDPSYWRPFESSIESRRRIEHAKKGEYKYRGRWMSRAAILAQILSQPQMHGAVMTPSERQLFFGGKSFVRITVPGTNFELLVRGPDKDETYESFIEEVTRLLSEK